MHSRAPGFGWGRAFFASVVSVVWAFVAPPAHHALASVILHRLAAGGAQLYHVESKLAESGEEHRGRRDVGPVEHLLDGVVLLLLVVVHSHEPTTDGELAQEHGAAAETTLKFMTPRGFYDAGGIL